MKRLLPLVSLSFLLLASSAAGDGCPPETCGVQSTALPGSPVVVLRSQGVVVAYDVVTGKRRFTLPYAVDSADGRGHFVAWTRRSTVVRRYGVTGRLEGRWRLGARLGPAVASATGRRLVLVDAHSSRRHTRLVVLDTRAGSEREVTLAGSFQPEAVSNDGRRLFLIEYLRRGYRVRLYDLARGALLPGALRPKNDDEPMRGFPAYAIGAPGGRWLLTLYVKPVHREAFVHALDLRNAVAYCVDLPGHGSGYALGKWALALGLDGTTLFAANPALGLATQIDLRTLETPPAVTFRRSEAGGSWTNAAVSPRGDLVYVGGLRKLWAYDARVRRMRGPYRVGRISGFGFTPDGRRLTVIAPGDRVFWLDAATGKRL
jgi:hypothetical protein